MHIVVLNWQDRLNPRAGGAEVHLHELFGRLVARGHRVSVLASGWAGGPARDVVDGLEVHRVGGRHSFPAHVARYFRRQLRREADVVVEDLNKLPLLAHRWSERPTVLLVHHLFGRVAFGSAPLPVALASWLGERLLLPHYRGVPVQAVSESTRDELVARGLHAADVRVIRNGVAPPAPGADARARGVVPTLLALGRLVPYKRVDLLLHALARLRALGVPARLVVAGEGPSRAGLQRLAAQLQLGDAVRFAGRVSEAEKWALLRSCTLHVIASEKEGWGLGVLEAAACETATVATNVPGLRDAVVHERTGLLVPPGDAVALADAVRRLLEQPERRRALERNARAHAARHSWDAAAGATEEHLQAVVDAAGGQHAPPPLRRRAPHGRVSLPRLGDGLLPYGTTAFAARLTVRGRALTLHAILGAAEPGGREPRLLLLGLGVRLRARLRAPGQQLTPLPHASPPGAILFALDGWPDQPAAWLAELILVLLPDARVVAIEREPPAVHLPASRAAAP